MRLWNPPFNVLLVVVRMIRSDEGRGVLLAPNWPAQAWFARFKELACDLHILHPSTDVLQLLESSRPINAG